MTVWDVHLHLIIFGPFPNSLGIVLGEYDGEAHYDNPQYIELLGPLRVRSYDDNMIYKRVTFCDDKVSPL